MNNDIDDLLFFVDETATTNPLATSLSLPAWQVLVVDDDADVHEATRFALDGILIFDRPLTLIHAYSAAEALERLRQPHEVAVILLDVVMETHTAGLEIIDVIRGELGLHNTRIILRTGQPGYAPEIDTIRRYDINDYKTKSELTRNKLFTTLSSALRTYDQLCRLDASRRGLEQIVVASRQLMSRREMQCFAKAALAQLAQYAGVPEDGLICGGNNLQQPTEFMVFAGGGRYEMETGRHAGEVDMRQQAVVDQRDHPGGVAIAQRRVGLDRLDQFGGDALDQHLGALAGLRQSAASQAGKGKGCRPTQGRAAVDGKVHVVFPVCKRSPDEGLLPGHCSGGR